MNLDDVMLFAFEWILAITTIELLMLMIFLAYRSK